MVFPLSFWGRQLSYSLTACAIRASLSQFILEILSLTIRELFSASGAVAVVVSLVSFDGVAALTGRTRLSAFDLTRQKNSVGPADALLAFVLIFLARRPRAFLLSTGK